MLDIGKFHTFLKKVGVGATKTAKRIIAVPVHFLNCGCRASDTWTILLVWLGGKKTVIRPQWSTHTVPYKSNSSSFCGNGNNRLYQPQVASSSSSFFSSSVVSVIDEGESDRFLHLCSSGRFHGPYFIVRQVRFQHCRPKCVNFCSRFRLVLTASARARLFTLTSVWIVLVLCAPSPAAGLQWWSLICAGVGMALPLNALSCRLKLGADWLTGATVDCNSSFR